MGNQINVILQYILMASLVAMVIWLLFLNRSTKKEKRLSKFTIDPVTEKPKSFFDKVEDIYSNLIGNLSKKLLKIKIFDKYSEKYEVFVDKSVRIKEKSMDYISNKIVIAVIAVIVTILSDVLRSESITFLQLITSLLIGFFIPDVFLYFRNKRRKKQIEEDLLKAVTIMGNALKSGRSTMQVIELVSNELSGPIATEFKKMYIDLTYGLELEVVFDRFAKRVPTDDVKYMTSSLIILNKTGGNIVEVFSSIERSFFDRKKLRQELKSITALSELVFKLLVVIPFIIFIVIFIMNPLYFSSLVTTKIGMLVLFAIVAIYVIYILVAKKVMKMEDW
ncbi:MAG TPA: type II secretion system F family protein [Bacilli bacterium]|nr:type II secretion system F family protein [Bacilli bacterium]